MENEESFTSEFVSSILEKIRESNHIEIELTKTFINKKQMKVERTTLFKMSQPFLFDIYGIVNIDRR
jgi:hypothetical protein